MKPGPAVEGIAAIWSAVNPVHAPLGIDDNSVAEIVENSEGSRELSIVDVILYQVTAWAGRKRAEKRKKSKEGSEGCAITRERKWWREKKLMNSHVWVRIGVNPKNEKTLKRKVYIYLTKMSDIRYFMRKFLTF